MLDRIKEELDTAQERLREASNRLNKSGNGEWIRNARHQVHIVKGEGQERLWLLEQKALELVGSAIEKADGLPSSERVTEPLEKLVEQRKTQALANPVAEFDQLNARAAASSVRQLGRVDLLKVEHYERENKGRKTVFQAIDRRRVVLNKPPFEADAA
jgi:hypothetical protein